MRILWIFLGYICFLVDSEDDVLICNGDSHVHQEFIREMYTLYPVEPLTFECGLGKANLESTHDIGVIGCYTLLLGAILCHQLLNDERNKRLDRCSILDVKRLDQAQNLNLRIPSKDFNLPTDAYAGFYVNISTKSGAASEFLVRDSKSVVWRCFKLDSSSVYRPSCGIEDVKVGVDCDNVLISFPLAFYNMAWKVGANTLLTYDEGSMYPDVAYSSNLLLQAKKSSGRLAKISGSNKNWGFVCKGCTAPYFKIKVKWTMTLTDPIKGRSVEPGMGNIRGRRRLMSFEGEEGRGKYAYYNNITLDDYKSSMARSRRLLLATTSPLKKTYTCWKRQIVIEEVFDSGVENMRCLMPFTTNQIRRKLAAGQSATLISEELLTETWGVSNNGAFIVSFPRQYSLNIIECIQSGKVWKRFSEITPGSCVACATPFLSAKNNLISRVCDMSNPMEANQDCCFSCRPKYMPSSDSYPPVCIASCKPGQTFHTYSKCTLCPAGTYSTGGLGYCLPCHELGYTNARIVAGAGCQSCGLRAYANGAKCTACEKGTFVQPEGFTCIGCTQSGYYLPESTLATACLACDYGTFMERNTITCSQCPQDTYNPTLASSSCSTCPIGTLSIPNRSTCVPCTTLNVTKLPLAEYFEPGCRLRCNPANSYVKTNPRSVDGCGRCEDVVLPIGLYSEAGACSVGARCINGPVNSYYTSAARFPSTQCDWVCIAGHNLVNGQCPSCIYAANTFISEKHQHTEGCLYNCKPYVYREPTLACDQPCKDLIQEHGNHNMIFARIRDYPLTTASKPNYILGVCGSDETVPRSDIPFMRLGRWAYSSLSAATIASACGNSLLNVGEECDDGNTADWDGCSSLCKIETGFYWDCDLIGVACLPNCGWKVSNIEDWGISLEGYILPPCSPGAVLCSCANLLYYDIVRLPVGQRGTWMSNNLISCGCGGNVLRTIPYAECNIMNQGCRLCSAGQYHDDLLGMCVLCGSSCPIAFTRDTTIVNSKCGPLISTSVLSSSTTQREESIGCKACPNSLGLDLRFIQDDEGNPNKCRFICYKDTTGESQIRDTYCKTRTNTSLESDGECTSYCIKCSIALDDLLASEAIVGGMKQIGYYPKGCSDVVGYAWAPCDSDSKPKGSSFSTTSLVPGASTGCGWVCNDGYLLSKGACVQCFQDTLSIMPCISGEQTVVCGSGKLACVPCDGPLPFPLQVWASIPPSYDSCFPECEVGISWGLEDEGGCEECSLYSSCDMGESYVQCSVRNDSTCIPCVGLLGENSEYIVGGSCLTRCKSGYYLPPYGNSQCQVCVPLGSCKPENGVRPSSTCVEPIDRNDMPTCESCDTSLQVQEAWSFTTPCVAVCVYGSVRRYSNNTCVACRPSLCEKGQYGACTTTYSELVTELTCTPCPSSAELNSQYAIAGDCVKSCNEGYIENESGLCTLKRVLPPPVDANSGENNNNNQSAEEALVYPTRTQRHSGMK